MRRVGRERDERHRDTGMDTEESGAREARGDTTPHAKRDQAAAAVNLGKLTLLWG